MILVFYSLLKSTPLPQDTYECLCMKRNLHNLQSGANPSDFEGFQGKKPLENMYFSSNFGGFWPLVLLELDGLACNPKV